jgi:OmpA-OmpF porin, OOP family
MPVNHKAGAIGLALTAALWPALAAAQNADALMAMSVEELRGEIGTRYDAALALTRDGGVVSADNPRFLWASQAKAQCGIALGFLKSGTKDPVSIGKCDDAYNRMQQQPAPPPPPLPPVNTCNRVPFIVFFDWDSDAISAEAATTLDATVEMLRGCGFPAVKLDGYTDRSGTDRYNQGLSQRRSDSVRAYLVSRGVPEAAITTAAFGETNLRVPTEDGVRELQNRRVEIAAQ